MTKYPMGNGSVINRDNLDADLQVVSCVQRRNCPTFDPASQDSVQPQGHSREDDKNPTYIQLAGVLNQLQISITELQISVITVH